MENQNKTQFPPILLVLFAVLLWSTGGLFIKLTSLNAVHVNLGRALFAAITVGIFIAIRKELKFDWFVVFIVWSVLCAECVARVFISFGGLFLLLATTETPSSEAKKGHLSHRKAA